MLIFSPKKLLEMVVQRYFRKAGWEKKLVVMKIKIYLTEFLNVFDVITNNREKVISYSYL